MGEYSKGKATTIRALAVHKLGLYGASTVDNRNLLAQKNPGIAKHLDQALSMRNQLYEANRKHTRETYELKQRIKSLEEEKARLQEQLQLAQACMYSNCTW